MGAFTELGYPIDWHHEMQLKPIENQIMVINKNQFIFDRILGSGSYGCVYAARYLPDSMEMSFYLLLLKKHSALMIQTCLLPLR